MADRTVGERLVRVESDLDNLAQDVQGIRSILKWIGFTVGGAVLLAVTNWVINGGLNVGV